MHLYVKPFGWLILFLVFEPCAGVLSQQPGRARIGQSAPVTSPSRSPRPRQPSLSRTTRRRQPPTRVASSRRSFARLTSVPNLFGDFGPTATFVATALPTPVTVPVIGSLRTSKVAENTKAVPVDRIYCVYNHFANALAINGDDRSFERFTFGFERALNCNRSSIEVRLPWSPTVEVNSARLSYESQSIGDLTLIGKHVLHRTPSSVLSAGIGLTLPTGSDTEFAIRTGGTTGFFRVDPETTFVSPFVGVLIAPKNGWFFHGFAQVDIPVADQDIQITTNTGAPQATLTADQLSLLFIDVSLGRWFYRDVNRDYFTGLAGLVELHYNDSISGASTAVSPVGAFGTMTATTRPLTTTNLTAGVHLQVTQLTDLRIASVSPLDGGDRLFDAELQVAFNRRF